MNMVTRSLTLYRLEFGDKSQQTKDGFLPLIATNVLPLGGCLLAEDARYTNWPHVVRYSTTNLHEHLPSSTFWTAGEMKPSKQFSMILVSVFVALKVM